MIGLAATWTKAKLVTGLLDEFQKIVLALVSRIIIPILPLFIGSTFCGLAYEGTITRQLPVFLEIIVLVLAGHFIWMAFLYILAGIYSGENPLEVVRHYAPAYLTAVGTMSSAATLAVALQCASRAKPLRKDLVNFGIPLFANIHLCGSVLTEVFFCMAVPRSCTALFRRQELWFCFVCFSVYSPSALPVSPAELLWHPLASLPVC